MSWTVVVSTYENPRALASCLAALSRMRGTFETVVADDGSGPETLAALGRWAPALAPHGRVRHVRHAHDGFRRCRIVNHAIAGCRSERVAFVDGDCLVGSDYLEAMTRLCAPNRYVAGGALRLGREASSELDEAAVSRGGHERVAFRAGVLVRGRAESKAHYGVLPRALRPLFRRRSGGWMGGCSATWRSLLVAANGWDERFRYGFDDTDLGHRLQNAGVSPLSARLDALVLHLWHDRPYRDAAVFEASRQLALANFRSSETRAVRGLAELAGGDAPAWTTLG